MSDQNSLFNTNNSQATPATATPNSQLSTVDTMLQSILNEKGEQKYRTVEDAIKALQHSQSYIPTLAEDKRRLEAEIETLREQASKVNELEESVKRILSSQQTTATPAVNSIDEGSIKELISNSLSEAKKIEQQERNTKEVTAAVVSRFGSDAEKIFYAKAAEIGMTVAEFNQMAASRPKAVLTLLGIQDTAGQVQNRQQSTHQSVINTAAVDPTQQTYIGKNKEPALLGATTQQVREEAERSRKMVEELRAQGKSVYDLTDPKHFFKTFG